jgi:hypothetical protein
MAIALSRMSRKAGAGFPQRTAPRTCAKDLRQDHAPRALIKPAPYDARIFGGRIFDRLGRCGRFALLRGSGRRRSGLHPADLNFAVLAARRFAALRFARRRTRGYNCGSGRWRCAGRRSVRSVGRRRCRILRGLTMRNEFIIARRSRPRRRIGRQPTGPMRPVIGDIAGKRTTGAERCAKPQHNAWGNEPFDNHDGRRVVGPARRVHRAPLTILSDRVAGH